MSVAMPSSAEAHGVVGLQRGSSGPAVRELQVALMNNGIAISGGADGVYGGVTENAVTAFQKRYKLSQTGVVDEATASALGLGSSHASSPSGFVGLSRGMKGADVRLLQHALIQAGWSLTVGPDGTPDGAFGAETEAAVRDVQRVNGLDATGVVNEATAQALGVTETWGSDGELAQGSSGDKVLEVQQAIIRDGGFLFGGADGYFGPGTTSAVKKYQLVNDLAVTGVVDQATADVMGIDLASSSTGGTVMASEEPAAENSSTQGSSTNSSPSESSSTETSSGGNDASASTGEQQESRNSGAAEAEPAIQYTTATRVVGLELGHKGKPVRQVQQTLSGFGYVLRGGIDGLYGPETEAAIKHFQSSNGLDTSGTINRATASALGLVGGSSTDSGSGSGGSGSDENNNSPAPPSYSHPYGGLQRGSTGDKVRDVQEALLDTGLVIFGGADGFFGPATESAVKSFQKVNALPITGIVDDATAKILDPQPSNSSDSGSGSSGGSGGAGIGNSPPVTIDVFPVGGPCWYGNSWHAPRGGGRVHLGVDIIADQGQPVYAASSGTITRKYIDKPGSLAGNGLRLTRSDGTYFFYAHLYGFAPGIKEGTKVNAGDVIGTVGTTGGSAGPHLHFEVHPNGGDAVDPTAIVRNARSGGC